MGKAFYRKYRPKKLSEIFGQEHVTSTLERALKKGTLSHAYLLTGPKGVGKTSIARILAYEVNGLPYDEEATHLDIVEIDAASNRRIDEIRELKERVFIAPTSAKYRVYIIDEVHMLTKEAFNALLKTLEEPPEHAIFILATTEAHKVPETIISRTQRFTLKPIGLDKVVDHLRYIAKQETISVSDAALGLIASHGNGSFRDSISLLDQLRHVNNPIELQDVQQAIGQAPDDLLLELANSLQASSLSNVADSLAKLTAQGIQPQQVAQQLSRLLRNDVLNPDPMFPASQSLRLLQDLVEVGAASDPGLKLELAMYSAALENAPDAKPLAVEQKEPITTNISKSAQEQTITESEPRHKPQDQKTKTAVDPSANQSGTISDLNSETWPGVLAAIKSKHNTLYGITRMAIPSFEAGKITLHFAFAFHQKRLDESKNKQLLMDIIHKLTGQNVSILCVLDAKTKAKPAPKLTEPEDTNDKDISIQTISNIFGGAEIVE